MPGRHRETDLRFLVMLSTAGFVFPNACVEGRDLTDIQYQHEGKLYAKK